MLGYFADDENSPMKLAVDGGRMTNTGCLACVTVNCYLVTCEVAVVVGIGATTAAETSVTDAQDETKEALLAVDAVQNQLETMEVDD